MMLLIVRFELTESRFSIFLSCKSRGEAPPTRIKLEVGSMRCTHCMLSCMQRDHTRWFGPPSALRRAVVGAVERIPRIPVCFASSLSRFAAEPESPMSTQDVVAFMRENRVLLAPPESSQQQTQIKCVLFLIDKRRPLLAIVPIEDRIDELALARWLSVPKRKVKMAPASSLVELCGFAAGNVPPFGHHRPLETVVDETLVLRSSVTFGENLEFVVPTAEMLRLSKGIVAPIGRSRASIAGVANSGVKSLEQCRKLGRLPLPSPWPAGCHAAVVEGIIAQKRQMARLLVFLTIVPMSSASDWASDRANLASFVRRQWSHPDAGLRTVSSTSPCEVQIICGKTIERSLGRSDAAHLFKSLRVGQAIKVIGRPQDHLYSRRETELGLNNTVDIVAHSIEVMHVDSRNGSRTGVELASYPGVESVPFASKPKSKADASPSTGKYKPREMYRAPQTDEGVMIVDDLESIHKMADYILSGPIACTSSGRVNGDLIDMFSSRLEKGYIEASRTNFALPRRGKCKHQAITASKQALEDPIPVKQVVGIDCEWQPCSRADPSTPVSILQISTLSHIFLIDMLKLCHAVAEHNLHEGLPTRKGLTLSLEQILLSDVLETMFTDSEILKVGFGIKYDLKRLVESYPWLPCFGGAHALGERDYLGMETVVVDGDGGKEGIKPGDASFEDDGGTMSMEQRMQSSCVGRVRSSTDRSEIPFRSHIDLLAMARIASAGHIATKRLGLSSLAAMALGVGIDKTEQRSSWGHRPLTQSQIQYAAADAAALIDIFGAMLNARPELLSPYWMSQLHSNLTHIPSSQIQQRKVVEKASSPAWPSKDATLPMFTRKSSMPGMVVAARRQLNHLRCDVEGLLSQLGQPISGGKVGVVRSAAVLDGQMEIDGRQVPQEINTGRKTGRVPHFPRGSGLLEFSNAFCLFVNVPSRSYPNTFTIVSEGLHGTSPACIMSWWPGRGQTLDHPVIQRLLGSFAAKHRDKDDRNDSSVLPEASPAVEFDGRAEADDASERIDVEDHRVLLFIRPDKDDYICCGRLSVHQVRIVDGQLSVLWNLDEYGALRNIPYFQEILKLASYGFEEAENTLLDPPDSDDLEDSFESEDDETGIGGVRIIQY